jgi:hypothetical protein
LWQGLQGEARHDGSRLKHPHGQKKIQVPWCQSYKTIFYALSLMMMTNKLVRLSASKPFHPVANVIKPFST